MSKANSNDLDQMFEGMSVETSSQTKLLTPGQHIVNNKLGTCAIVLSHGSTDGSFADQVRQLKLRIEDTENGAEMDIFLTLDAHKRLSEITEADFNGVKGSHVSIKTTDWANMPLDERIDVLFSSYTNSDNEQVATCNFDVPAVINAKGQVVRPEMKKECRYLDPVRSTNIRKKLMSMLAVAEVFPKGTNAPKMSDIIDRLNSKVYEFGVVVAKGITNTKGQSMPRIEYFIPSDEVEG